MVNIINEDYRLTKVDIENSKLDGTKRDIRQSRENVFRLGNIEFERTICFVPATLANKRVLNKERLLFYYS